MRCIVESRVIPALLTSTSMGPSSASIALDTLGAGVEIGDIEFEDRDAGLFLEMLRCLVVAGIGRRDPITGILQGHRDRAADAARPAGDHRYPGHAFLPLRSRMDLIALHAHRDPHPAADAQGREALL